MYYFLIVRLKNHPEISHTEGLLSRSADLITRVGATAEIIRFIDHDIATGAMPDMREYGWKTDEWPALFEKVKKADVVIVCGPIWLGDNSSQTKKLIERLYGNSNEKNSKGQYIYYGKVGGVIITGNEDGVKHYSMNILYSLQHIGFTIPSAAESGWIGEFGPGPSYLDSGSGGLENETTNRNLTFMTYNLLHMAKLLNEAGGFPSYGNIPGEWEKGERFGFKN